MTEVPATGLSLRTTVRGSGHIALSLEERPVPQPAADQVVVRIEAAPINPSDLGLLIASADPATFVGEDGAAVAPLSAGAQRALAARADKPMPAGNEGAGTVVAAGDDPAAQALIGRTVAVLGGSMYTQYRLVPARDCVPLPEGVSAAEGASFFVNPLTALGMVETMRREGHKAIVHTAAASNLGQMLSRLCQAEGVPLVNIVRSAAQAEILRSDGATEVCNSSAPGFQDALTAALERTGATIAFDAIGGGRLANHILVAMETVAARREGEYSRYGSSAFKQVYIYGSLDTGPTELTRSFGLSWAVGGWLLTPFLQKIGADETQKLRERVARDIRTVFASGYSRTIALTEMVDPAMIAAYGRRATGEKYLVDPSRG